MHGQLFLEIQILKAASTLSNFFQCFPKITDKIKELRDKLNVRVIRTTDPLTLAARTDPTTATTTANCFATKTTLTTSNLAVTTATTEPTTATTAADSLATEMVLTTSNLVMSAEINAELARGYIIMKQITKHHKL